MCEKFSSKNRLLSYDNFFNTNTNTATDANAITITITTRLMQIVRPWQEGGRNSDMIILILILILL